MMTSVSGERGIGKTYHLAKEVYKHYLNGFICITNFSHIYSHIDCSNEKPDVLIEIIRQIGEFKKGGWEWCDLMPCFKHTGLFMAIDEAHLIFGADRFKRYQSDPNFQFIIQFLAQARKQDVNIWYSTQDPSKIDINWRRYTEEWIRYKAVLPWKRRISVPHPSRPTRRREIRYIIPLVWEERHWLDSDHPHFNYSKSTNDGVTTWSQASTLAKRRMVLSGWLDPFPYKLYDSHQLIGLDYEGGGEFDKLFNVSYIPHTMRREKFPLMKRILGLTLNDEKVPTRYRAKKITLPDIGAFEPTTLAKQPIEFLDDIAFFNKKKAKVNFKRRRVGSVPLEEKKVNKRKERRDEKKAFKCPICERVFESVRGFRAHKCSVKSSSKHNNTKRQRKARLFDFLFT